MKARRTTFASQKDGFRFRNAFDPRGPLLKRFNPQPLVMGLCGGMCYAALDYENSGQPVPSFHAPDQLDARLARYLYRRQFESLSPLVLLRLADWIFHADEYVGTKTCAGELPRICQLLDAGLPAVLCLVRTRGLTDPTINHQVTAIGYEVMGENSLRLFLYDPNHPGKETELYLPLRWHPGAEMFQSTGEALRGLFIMPYRPARPPMLEA